MSGTSRDLRSAERLELKRHQEYQDLKRLVMDQAPSSNFKKGTEEAVRVKMAVAYRDYMKGGWSTVDDIKVDVIQDARLRIELAVSWNLAAEMFNVSKNQVRRLSKKGIDTPSSKDGRPKAATKEILEDAANIIQAHALSDDVLSKKQCHELLRDLFAGLGTSRLNKIKSGVPIASAGVL